MALLPKKVGSFTLMRRLGADGVVESFVAILDEPAGKQVIAHRLLPFVLGEATRLGAVEQRVADLVAIRHPVVVPTLSYQVLGDDRYVLSDWIEAVSLADLISHCAHTKTVMPHNVYLNLSTQICNGLEALHSRAGATTLTANVLHQALRPDCILLTADGRVLVGSPGLMRSPTGVPQTAASGNLAPRLEYLSPEQTHNGHKLSPSSDVFSLGSILYEALTLQPMFRSASNLQTIHRLRRAEVTSQLLEVKEILPGLDKVLYRALSLNPRHRYQRAFVLREDLRGLMAGYSFSNIVQDTQSFLAPMFARRAATQEELPVIRPEEVQEETTNALLELSLSDPPGPLPADQTGAFLRKMQDDEPPEEDEQPFNSPDPGAFDGEEVTDVSVATSAEVHTSWIQRKPAPRPEPEPEPEPEPAALPPAPLPDPDAYDGEDHTKTLPAALMGAQFVEDSAAGDTVPGTSDEAIKALGAGEDLRPPGTGTPAPALSAFDQAAKTKPAHKLKTDDDDLDEWRSTKGANPAWVIGGLAVAALMLLVCAGVGSTTGALGVLGLRANSAVDVSAAPHAPKEPSAAATASAPEPKLADANPEPVQATGRPSPRAAPRLPATAPRPPSPRPQPRAASMPRPEYSRALPPPPPVEPDAVAEVEYPTSEDEYEAAPTSPSDLSALADRALIGRLSDTERAELAATGTGDPTYTRAYVMLYQDAKARRSNNSRSRYLDALMRVPENRYKPELLVEQAELAIVNVDYDVALSSAQLAERHWARLPSDLVFTRKAMIYEIQAAAHTGKFYASDGAELDELEHAIRDWERYRQHVGTKHRADLEQRADERLAQLYDMQQRLE